MKIFAHRGASLDAPENTLTAFRHAWQQGAHGTELDVHLTRDGRILVIHDPDTLRTTGHKHTIAATDSADLRKLNAAAGTSFPPEPIPFLEEVIAEIPPARALLIEIKSGPEIIPHLAALNLPPATTGFLSFDLPVLAEVKRTMPAHLCLWNVEPPWNRIRNAYETYAAQTRAHNLDGLSLGWYRGYIPGHVGYLHDAGLTVATWTIDDPQAARAAQACGIDILITNRPAHIQTALTTT